MPLPEPPDAASASAQAPAAGDLRSLKKVGSMAAQSAEKELVLRTLQGCGWNRKQAARELGICYKALLNKLKRWEAEEGDGAEARLLVEEAPVAASVAPPPMTGARSQGRGR